MDKKYKIVAVQVPLDRGVTEKSIKQMLSLCDCKSGLYHLFTLEGASSSVYAIMDFDLGDLETIEVESKTILAPILDDSNEEREDHTYYSSFLDTEIYMFSEEDEEKEDNEHANN